MNALDTAKQNIANAIIANGNNEITADVLRPLLEAICDATLSITGDPDNLTTTANDTLVNAINELKDITSNLTGVVILTGNDDPNNTPPPGASLGNYYARYGLNSSLLGFWIYNGYDWIKIDKLREYTVSTLPIGEIGDEAYVTDADNPTYLGVASGGGSVICRVFFNGTNWIT